jgi:hypothetical protein
VSVNGSSAAAALTAGAAALLAQARPRLDAPALRSLLAGNARRGLDGVTTAGTGTLDLGAAVAGEVASAPVSLAFGEWTGPKWKGTQTLTLRNVSTRRLHLSLAARPEGGESELLAFRFEPQTLVLRQGASATVKVTAALAAKPTGDVGSGTIDVTPAGGEPLRIPWAIDYRPYTGPLLANATLSDTSFAPSSAAPSRLSLDAGALVRTAETSEVEPVARLDVELWRGAQQLGLLARVRDLLPGRYTFGLTGRDPNGVELPAGAYRLRLVAWPTGAGKATVRTLAFTVT